MPVRLIKPYAGQNANTLYFGTDEAVLLATQIADTAIEQASDYAPSTRIVTAAAANTSRTATVYKMNSASAQTLTLSTSGYWPVGGIVTVEALGAGSVTVTPASGVTINGSAASVTVAAQNIEARLLKIGPDAWATMDGFTVNASATAGGLGYASGTPRIGTLGDSRTQDEFNVTASYGYKNVGYMTWLRQLTRQRFTHGLADVFATSGFNTQQIIDTWLTPAAQSSCAGMVVLCSTNDRVQGLTLAQTTANLDKILTTLVNSGKWVILVAEVPRGNAAFNPTQRLTGTPMQNHMAVRRWCQQQASRPNVYVVDPWPLMLADVTSTDATAGMDIAANMTRDGLHYGGQGAFTLASLMQPIVEQKLPRAEVLPVSNFDLFSADNPGGSITPNPMMSGSGGALVPTTGTLTGPVPVGYRAETINCAGVTVTLSTPTINGQIWWQAVISGTPTSANPKLQLRHGAQSAAVVGDTLEMVAEYQVDAGQTGMNAVQIFWNDSGGANYYTDGGSTGAAFNFPSNAVAGVLRSPQAQVVTAGNTSDEFGILLQQNVAVSATVRMRALSYRKVV